MSAKTTEERLADLERAVARMESRAQAGRPTPLGVVPPMGGQVCADCKTPRLVLSLNSDGRFICVTCLHKHMGLLCKHCNEPLSNGEPHGRGHCCPPRTGGMTGYGGSTSGVAGLNPMMPTRGETVSATSAAEATAFGNTESEVEAKLKAWIGTRDPLGVQRGVEQAPKPGPTALLGEATTLAYRAEALAFEALHAKALSVATQDIHSARALLVEAVSALKRAKAWTENSK